MSPGRARSNAAAIAAGPVGDQEQVPAAALAAVLGAAGDVVEDRLAVLAARILVGHDDEPGMPGGDPAHHRPLGRVALPGRAEDRDHAAAARRRERARAARGPSRATPGCGRSR